jgi:nucleotide-binding universal stress UspA family protein
MKLRSLAPHRLALSYRTDSLCDNRSSHVSCHEGAVKTPRILVPIQGDERSGKLLAAAAAFARPLGAELVLLHVYEMVEYAPAHTTPAQLRDWNAALQQTAEERLTRIKESCLADSIVGAARTIVVCGDLQEEVLKAAKALRADLIMISTHAYSRIRHLFLGSKAESILHHSGCPVLVLPRFS